MNRADAQTALDQQSFWLPTRKDLVAKGITYPARSADMGVFLKEIDKTAPRHLRDQRRPRVQRSGHAHGEGDQQALRRPAGAAVDDRRERVGKSGSERGRTSVAKSGWRAWPPEEITPRKIAPYLFILPNMALFAAFTIWPAISGFNMSLYDSSNGRTFRPVGLGNYAEIVTSDEFWRVARQTAVFVIVLVVVTTIAATALALLLNAQQRGRGVLRGAYLLPFLVSPVVIGLIWGWRSERQGGLVNTVLDAIGLGRPRLAARRRPGDGGDHRRRAVGTGRLLRADPAGRAAGHRRGAVRGRADGRGHTGGSRSG